MCVSRKYRAKKQEKTRQYRAQVVNELDNAVKTNLSNMWPILQKLSSNKNCINMPSGDEFLEHFKMLNNTEAVAYHDDSYEQHAIEFLNKSELSGRMGKSVQSYRDYKYDIINGNFSDEEIGNAIDYLKNNKTPGVDNINAEFLKSSKIELVPWITLVLKAGL